MCICPWFRIKPLKQMKRQKYKSVVPNFKQLTGEVSKMQNFHLNMKLCGILSGWLPFFFFPQYMLSSMHQKHNQTHSRKVRRAKEKKSKKGNPNPLIPTFLNMQNHITPTQYAFTYSWARWLLPIPFKHLPWYPRPTHT